MRKFTTTDITSVASMPFKRGSLEHIQNMITDLMKATFRCIGTDDSFGGSVAKDIVYGCVNTGSGSNYIFSDGVIYTGAEMFYVEAATFTTTSGYPIFVLDESQFTATYADPVEFSDGNNYDVHDIRTLVIQEGTTGTTGYIGTVSEFTNKQRPRSYKVGDNGVAYETGFEDGTNGNVVYRKENSGLVTINGYCEVDGTPSITDPIFTLPVGFRPPVELQFTGMTYYSTQLYKCFGTIRTNGELQLAVVDSSWGGGINYIDGQNLIFNISFYGE